MREVRIRIKKLVKIALNTDGSGLAPTSLSGHFHNRKSNSAKLRFMFADSDRTPFLPGYARLGHAPQAIEPFYPRQRCRGFFLPEK
jgi:hypothetical protein